MYAKLNKDGTLTTASDRYIKEDGKIIANPTKECFKKYGSKPLAPDAPPEITGGSVPNAYYEEDENEIRLVIRR